VKMRPDAAVMAHPSSRVAVSCHWQLAHHSTSCSEVVGQRSLHNVCEAPDSQPLISTQLSKHEIGVAPDSQALILANVHITLRLRAT
jgi:hypothetical protein